MAGRATTKRAATTVQAPQHDWRTSDEDEIERRRKRAAQESFRIGNLDSRHPVYSNFRVESGSGMTYSVEIRDLGDREFACDCVDFRINALGTCKHVEAVLLHLEARFRRLLRTAAEAGSDRLDVIPHPARDTLRIERHGNPLPRALRKWFGSDDELLENLSPEDAVAFLSACELPQLRLSQEVAPWLEQRRRQAQRRQLRHEYELKVQAGQWPAQETRVALFPYQREGMLHLAFTERALLADEMGLGKTIQAIAACALLHRLGQARRVLVVTPASLKTEWEEQIARFTDLRYQLVFGGRPKRLAAYDQGQDTFFTLVNYEQMLPDALEVNQRLAPDVVVLDEAQRIKNWGNKTTQAIKRLRSRYAFVLTGTPIENRIDELHSLMDFLNPEVLGPLFRFNREYYALDERGRPSGYRNLDQLHARIAPWMLRRRKAEVETELPERSTRNHFVELSDTQKSAYADHEHEVARLASIARRRPLSPQEQDKLMRELAMMRMICDTNYILDPEDRTCPKLDELSRILEDCRDNDAKLIVFSEWERMLELVRERCGQLGIGHAWHTGSVPQQRRRAEINAFKNDPACRVFLSTDSGSTGLNLQVASVVVNCDLPWNPARLEQRIARAWRKHQTRPVTVINLVAENTIEHRMLDTLASKQALADGVLDLEGDLTQIKLRTGKQSLLARLEQLVGPAPAASPKPQTDRAVLPADRALGFAQRARAHLDGALLRCEERFPQQGAHSVLCVVVERDADGWRPRLATLHEELFGPGRSDPLAPVQLEVIDRATDEALQRLLAAGLVTSATRATRVLHPATATDAPPVLSAEQRAAVEAHRKQATHKLRMARVLGEGGFAEEARGPLLEAILLLGRGLALESGMPEPVSPDDAVLPPLASSWSDVLPAARSFVAGDTQKWKFLVERLPVAAPGPAQAC